MLRLSASPAAGDHRRSPQSARAEDRGVIWVVMPRRTFALFEPRGGGSTGQSPRGFSRNAPKDFRTIRTRRKDYMAIDVA